MTERKVEISHERYATHAPARQFTITTLKISTATTKFSDAGRGSVGRPATGRKPISADRSGYQRTKGGFEEINIPTQPE